MEYFWAFSLLFRIITRKRFCVRQLTDDKRFSRNVGGRLCLMFIPVIPKEFISFNMMNHFFRHILHQAVITVFYQTGNGCGIYLKGFRLYAFQNKDLL